MAGVGDEGPAQKQIKTNDTTIDKNPGPSIALSELCSRRGSPSKLMPRSLLVAEMLRLGKHHFNMREMGWSGKATPVEFNIEHKPFGTEGGLESVQSYWQWKIHRAHMGRKTIP